MRIIELGTTRVGKRDASRKACGDSPKENCDSGGTLVTQDELTISNAYASSKLPGYRGPEGMPVFTRAHMRAGSRGGAVIWVMLEAFMPRGNTSPERVARLLARREAGDTLNGYEVMELAEHGETDGFAVFGRYPRGFIDHVLRLGLIGDVRRDDILHVCSGTLSDGEKWTVDIRAEARPRVRANGTALPFLDASFDAVMIDPPYSDQYARDLYGVENPRPSWLLREAARVVKPSGRIGMLHVAVPFPPLGCELVNVYGITTGVGFRIRAFTVFARKQGSLFDEVIGGGVTTARATKAKKKEEAQRMTTGHAKASPENERT